MFIYSCNNNSMDLKFYAENHLVLDKSTNYIVFSILRKTLASSILKEN